MLRLQTVSADSLPRKKYSQVHVWTDIARGHKGQRSLWIFLFIYMVHIWRHRIMDSWWPVCQYHGKILCIKRGMLMELIFALSLPVTKWRKYCIYCWVLKKSKHPLLLLHSRISRNFWNHFCARDFKTGAPELSCPCNYSVVYISELIAFLCQLRQFSLIFLSSGGPLDLMSCRVVAAGTREMAMFIAQEIQTIHYRRDDENWWKLSSCNLESDLLNYVTFARWMV